MFIKIIFGGVLIGVFILLRFVVQVIFSNSVVVSLGEFIEVMIVIVMGNNISVVVVLEIYIFSSVDVSINFNIKCLVLDDLYNCSMYIVICLCILDFFSVLESINVFISNKIIWFFSVDEVFLQLIILVMGNVIKGINEVMGIGNVLVI